MLFLQPIMLAGAFKVTKGMMLSDPAYEQYVKESGIDGNSDWHVDDMYSCGGPPCSAGWDFPAVSFPYDDISCHNFPDISCKLEKLLIFK